MRNTGGHRRARATPAATNSLSVRAALPVSSDSRTATQVAHSRSGTPNSSRNSAGIPAGPKWPANWACTAARRGDAVVAGSTGVVWRKGLGTAVSSSGTAARQRPPPELIIRRRGVPGRRTGGDTFPYRTRSATGSHVLPTV
ncbi:hypothetical protein GZL_02059 [Streptomyces sp. 769]|nr:hypothetical protein GZL_02059 [Streptomyces sp. 769]